MFFISIELEKESREGVNTLGPVKFRNNKLDKGLAERYTIKIEIPTVYIKILYLLPINLLFDRIIYNVSRFFCPRTSSVYRGVWFKECLKQIVRNLAVLKKQEETRGRRSVDPLHAVD